MRRTVPRAQQVTHFTKTPHRKPNYTRRMRESEADAPPQVHEAISRLLIHAGEPLRAAVLTRWLHLATDVLDVVATRTLSQSASASTDLSAVLASLEDMAVVEKLIQKYPALTTARIRGIEARQQILTAEGGTWTVAQVAKHLHLTRQAVDQRRRAGRILALPVGRHGYLYPAWQFSPEGMLPRLEPVLKALDPHDAWGKVVFLLSPHPDLSDKTPVQTLRAGKAAAVLEVAEAFAEHGQS